MDLDKIKIELESCDFSDLLEVERHLSQLLDTAQENIDRINNGSGQRIEREERFPTNLSGKLTRITNIRPGERKEYSVIIKNISRKGLNFKVDINFIPSRIVEISFASAKGKEKNCHMEIVRMRRQSNSNGKWFDVGCRSIDKDEVKQLQRQEDQISSIQSKLKQKTKLMIIAIGPQNNDTEQLISHLKSHDYQLRLVDNIHQAMISAENLSAQLVLFCEGSKLCNDRDMLLEAVSGPKGISTLAIVKNEEERLALLNAGIDESITENNFNSLIFHAIERAIIGNTIRNDKSKYTAPHVMIISNDNTRINMMTFYLEEKDYICCATDNLTDARQLHKKQFDLIITDFSPDDNDTFDEVLKNFQPTPIIALCDDISIGRQAIIHGAFNYLCTPPSREEVNSILDTALLKQQSKDK